MPKLTQLLPASLRDRHRSKWHEVQQFLLPTKTVIAKISRKVRPHSFPKLEGGEVYLHLGCGYVNHTQFVNIDVLPAPHIHYVGGVERLPYFKSNTVSLIYASHVLEHISYLKTQEVLQEWYRVLRPGGVLRVSAPDFDKLLEIYRASHNDMESILAVLMGGQDYKYNYHKAMFNQRSLTRMFMDAGFREVREWTPRSCELTNFNDFSTHTVEIQERPYPISLNLEAEK